MRTKRMARAVLLVPLVVAPSGGVAAEVSGWAAGESVLAVVTHKGGIAGGFAHEHLVVAGDAEVAFEFSAEAPAETRFEAEIGVEGLVVDDGDLQRRWYPRLHELGVVDQPFAEVSEADRAKIRESMLGPKQLAAESHPTIHARLLSVEPLEATTGPSHRITISLTVRETTVERALDAWSSSSDGRHRLEALGAFDFTDFGIQPYSAMLGAVKVLDTFHLFVSLSAAPPPRPEADGGSG